MVFDETLNCYTTTNSLRVADAEKLTAAWWAWQEQQVEIDCLNRQIIEKGQRFNEQSQRIKDLEFKYDEKEKSVIEQENSIKRETHKFIKNSIQETRIEQALSLIKAWDDQSYKDDAEQLINVDLVEALQGNDVIEDVRVNLSSLLDFVKSLRAEFDLNAVQGMEAVERQIELLEQFVGVDHD